jgi:hypothetical protein
MKKNDLYRSAAIAGGLSFLFTATLGVGKLFVSHNSAAYSLFNLIGGFGQIFFMFLLIAIYLDQFRRLGILGLFGFILSIFANSILTTGQIITAYIGQLSGFPAFLAGPVFYSGLFLIAFSNHRGGNIASAPLWTLFAGYLGIALIQGPLQVIPAVIYSLSIGRIALHYWKKRAS